TGKNLNKVRSVFVNGLETQNPNNITFAPLAAASATPAPTPTPASGNSGVVFDRYLIAIPNLPNFSKDKTLQVSLLTYEDAVNATPIDNPAFEKQPEPPIKYVFDETKLKIT